MMKALEAEKDFEETKPLWCEKDAKGNPVKDADGKPKPKAVDKTTIEWYDYDKDATAWRQKRDKYEDNKVTTCSIIIGQCTKALITKLEAKA